MTDIFEKGLMSATYVALVDAKVLEHMSPLERSASQGESEFEACKVERSVLQGVGVRGFKKAG